MGIDIYARWKGQTEEEKKAQYTGFSARAGSVGYLREAYHGAPYATRELLPEAFASDEREAAIPAAVLLERLPQVLKTVETRERTIYKGDDVSVADVTQSFKDFVALCERKEKETGEPVMIEASY